MSKRIFGMAPGGRMSLDRAATRRKVIWHQKQKTRQARPREKKGVQE